MNSLFAFNRRKSQSRWLLFARLLEAFCFANHYSWWLPDLSGYPFYGDSSGIQTSREFDCYGLGYRAGRWYAVGFCHLRSGIRLFRLDRVVNVQPGQLSFERPATFDVLEYLSASLASLSRAHAIEVLLSADLKTAQRALTPTFGLLESTPVGVVLRSQADDLRWFARELSRLPFGFEIRKPAALADALKSHARQLFKFAQPSLAST